MTVGSSIWDRTQRGSDADRMESAEKSDIRKSEVTDEIYHNMKKVYSRILSEMGQVVAGQDTVIEQILTSIFTKNHALLEGFPGLGKTLIVSTLAQLMDLKFKRIQCTPDLMPSDITGTYIIEEDNTRRKTFRFEMGPVFTNILLTDEINRATPKTQSALLEAMQERQVTVGNMTYPLERPFFVLATQNPIEMEGTYPLPEAQMDRFLLKILVDYPKSDEELRIVDLYTGEKMPAVNKILSKNNLLAIQDLTRKMPIANEIKDYAIKIVTATRPKNNGIAKQFLDYGASPRASIGLVLAAKARALINCRNYVSREDIKEMAFPVLRHRLILNFESERKWVTADEIIEKILREIK